MFNEHVNIGVNEETGEYILMIASDDGKRMVQIDVTDMVRGLIDHEVGRMVASGMLGVIGGHGGDGGEVVDGVVVDEGVVDGDVVGDVLSLGTARSGGIYSNRGIGFLDS